VKLRGVALVVLIPFVLAACGGSDLPAAPGTQRLAAANGQRLTLLSSGSSPISHVVIVIQENRSFDDLFATFPGADGTTVGRSKNGSGYQYIPLKKSPLKLRCDLRHSYNRYLSDYDGGKMDGFNSEGGSGHCTGLETAPYQYVNPTQIKPYWKIAQTYVLADHTFQTQGSGSFTAHQDLIAGATLIDKAQTKSIVENPDSTPWGCDAPKGTVTSLLQYVSGELVFKYHKGPFPCFTYETMRDLLDAQKVSWKYYSPPVFGDEGGLWNAFDAISAVRYGAEWGVNVTDSNKQFFTDISNNALPAVSWIIPDRKNSDHPGQGSDTGPSWVASIVNAVGQSSYWPSTAIVVVWDDWGGFYDHVPPPFQDDWGGLGFRVPMIVVSAYDKQGQSSQGGYISHTQYEFGSILKFVEDNFGLGRLGTTDVRANSIADCFAFRQKPRAFRVIPAQYSRQYFETQRPSYEPVDDE
jgi:phospholipase C